MFSCLCFVLFVCLVWFGFLFGFCFVLFVCLFLLLLLFVVFRLFVFVFVFVFFFFFVFVLFCFGYTLFWLVTLQKEDIDKSVMFSSGKFSQMNIPTINFHICLITGLMANVLTGFIAPHRLFI